MVGSSDATASGSGAGAGGPTRSPRSSRWQAHSFAKAPSHVATQEGSLSARVHKSRHVEPALREQPQTARASSSTQREARVKGINPPTHAVPVTPKAALKLYPKSLSEYELSECLEYPSIYYTGTVADKIKRNSSSQPNHGYDDDRGDYNIVMHDHFAYRYEVVDSLGKGSFGQVVKCYDYKTKGMIAVKVIRNKKRFHHQALVEVKILEHLRANDPDDQYNMIGMIDYFYFRNHLCISFQLMSMNLYEFIKNNNFHGLSLGLIRRFAIQLLSSLRFLRKHRIIHCDLKPENILLKQPNKSGIKVIDFGSSCFEDERVYTYIQSRFYRSPEVILGLPYNTGIDIWSLGCILAELYTGYPLFPGENEVEQLGCIMEVFGVPSRSMVDKSTRKKMFFDSSGNPRIVPNSRGKKRRPASKDFMSAVKCSDPLFIDFLSKCLRWDPKDRFSPDDCLQHEWILEAKASAPRKPLSVVAPEQQSSSSGRYRSSAKRQPAAAPHTDANSLFPQIPHSSRQPMSARRTKPVEQHAFGGGGNPYSSSYASSYGSGQQAKSYGYGYGKKAQSSSNHYSNHISIGGVLSKQPSTRRKW